MNEKATVWIGKLARKKPRKMLIENKELQSKYWGKFLHNLEPKS
jgi:hypothetical protein